MKCATCDWIISPTDLSVSTPKGDICTCCSSEILRWRIWPNEEPNKTGQYLVLDCRGLVEVSYWEMNEEENEGRWIPFPDELRYWRPIGPLPGGE